MTRDPREFLREAIRSGVLTPGQGREAAGKYEAARKRGERPDIEKILALSPPFESGSLENLLFQVRNGAIVPPSRRCRAPWSRVPRELEAVVLAAMAKDPALRYQSVAGLRAEIEAYRTGRTLAAARYNPFQRALKWAKRNRAAVTASGAALVALAFGLAAMAYTSRRERAKGAEELHASAEVDWKAAEEKHPFNPASPQDYFRSRIAALTAMGRSLSAHPAPPDEWKELVASRAAELQGKAQETGDWALAQVLANLPREWGAAGELEAERRAQEVNEAFAETVRKDRVRLDDALARVRDAEAATKEKKQGALVPGEVEERTRRLARSAKTALAGEVLTRLVEDRESQGTLARRFLVELLGRTGDVQATASDRDVTAPRLIAEVLSQDRPALERLGADEIGSWLCAAARLYVVAPTALPQVESLFDGVAGKFGAESSVANAARQAQKIAGVARDPDPDREELGDWLAAAAESGSEYTKRLIELARDEDRLSTAELVLVYDQLGMAGEDTPPEPGAPRPNELLRAAFEALPDEWLLDHVRPGTDNHARTRAREKAIHAALALSRLGDPTLAERLSERRYNSEEYSTFWNSTERALALAPQGLWPDPRTAEEYTKRGAARRDQGDLAGAIRDFDRAIELKPDYADAYTNRGLARAAQGDLSGAIRDYDRAIELKPDHAIAYSNRGSARESQGDLAGAIRDWESAIELNPRLWQAWTNRGIALARLGRNDEDRESFEKALSCCPEDMRAAVEAARRQALRE
ncbi:MAG: tetratricopeptide repeat protein [Planctomycetes bacterium]|nr:tetratricopeptide repeat protein [Planctomycetota bacterium]